MTDFISKPLALSKKLSGSRKIELTLFLSSKLRYFDGHFPSMKILPGIAQVDIVVNNSFTMFEILKGKKVKSIKKLELRRPVLPEQVCQLSIEIKRNYEINFTFGNKSEHILSYGIITTHD